MTVVVIVALSGVVGQRATTGSAAGPAATLSVRAPETVRGGLLFQSRIEIDALHDISQPRLVFQKGWFEGMQENSINPQPDGMVTRNGRVVMSYPDLQAGDHMTIWLQFQVNPTAIGHRRYGVELDAAERPIATVHRTITVLP
jgi:hypothetical protein